MQKSSTGAEINLEQGYNALFKATHVVFLIAISIHIG